MMSTFDQNALRMVERHAILLGGASSKSWMLGKPTERSKAVHSRIKLFPCRGACRASKTYSGEVTGARTKDPRKDSFLAATVDERGSHPSIAWTEVAEVLGHSRRVVRPARAWRESSFVRSEAVRHVVTIG